MQSALLFIHYLSFFPARFSIELALAYKVLINSSTCPSSHPPFLFPKLKCLLSDLLLPWCGAVKLNVVANN